MLHSTQRNAQTVLCVWDYQACCSCFDFALCTLLISWPQACFWPGLCFMFRICLPAFRSECFIAIASVPAFSHTTVMLLSFFYFNLHPVSEIGGLTRKNIHDSESSFSGKKTPQSWEAGHVSKLNMSFNNHRHSCRPYHKSMHRNFLHHKHEYTHKSKLSSLTRNIRHENTAQYRRDFTKTHEGINKSTN